MRYLLPFLTAWCAVLTPLVASTEPSVAEVRSVALAHAGLDGPTDQWSTRSRWRHLLPTVRGSLGRLDQWDDHVQFDEWLAVDDDGDVIFDAAKNQEKAERQSRVDYSLQATIDLGGLIFDSHELVAAREERARLDARYRLVEVVHAAYFERRDALEDLARQQGDARVHHLRRIRRLEARLDALTGGWFSNEIGRDGGAP